MTPIFVAALAFSTVSFRGPQRPLVPVYDHHVHLLSPAGATTKLQTVDLPADLAAALAARQRNWNNAKALDSSFTRDGAAYIFKWYRGAREISTFLTHGYTGPYTLNTMAYRVFGRQAEIHGYLAENDASQQPFGYFSLLMQNARKKGWKISSETQIFPGPAIEHEKTAADAIRELDAAGTREAVVLSDAYYFSLSKKERAGEYPRVKAENDWTAAQVHQFPKRLVAFFSVNPTRSFAISEIERCSKTGLFAGLKLHLNAARMNYQDPSELQKVQQVFRRANDLHLPIIIHLRSSDEYGRRDAEVFLHKILPYAPDVYIQVAHLWGGETFSPTALEVFANALSAHDPLTRNLHFDISGTWNSGYVKAKDYAEIVRMARQIGLDRIVYGSDAPAEQAWKEFRSRLPFTEAEFDQIAHQKAPFLKLAE